MKKLVSRKQYLIEPKWQIFFTVFLIAVGLISAFISGYLAYRLIYNNQLIIVKNGLHLSPQYLETMATQRGDLIHLWILSFVVLAAAIGAAGIFFSHKIVGPLFALRRAFSELNEGQFSQYLRFRKGDEFQELKDAYNEMLHAIRDKVSHELYELDKVREELNKMVQAEKKPEKQQELKILLQDVTDLANKKRIQLHTND